MDVSQFGLFALGAGGSAARPPGERGAAPPTRYRSVRRAVLALLRRLRRRPVGQHPLPAAA